MKIKSDKYDKRFSLLIRTRDVVCQRCGRAGRTECSHIFGRRNYAIRFDTRNAKALCHTCHRWWHSNPCDAREWLVGIIGQGNYNKLHLLANKVTKKPKPWELEETYKEMKEQLDYLESIPEEERTALQFRNKHKHIRRDD